MNWATCRLAKLGGAVVSPAVQTVRAHQRVWRCRDDNGITQPLNPPLLLARRKLMEAI